MVRFSLFAAAALIGAPAFAGNPLPAQPEPMVEAPVMVAPVYAASSGWTGGYVGAQLGWGDADASGGGVDSSGDGALGGLHAGYRYDFGGIVAGVELSHDWTDISLSGTTDVDVDSVTRLMGTVGYASGANLFYGALGVASAKGDAGGPSETLDGTVIGVGMAHMLNPNTTVGFEVLSHEFDAEDLNPGTGRRRHHHPGKSVV